MNKKIKIEKKDLANYISGKEPLARSAIDTLVKMYDGGNKDAEKLMEKILIGEIMFYDYDTIIKEVNVLRNRKG